MPRLKGSKNIKPKKEDLYKLLENKQNNEEEETDGEDDIIEPVEKESTVHDNTSKKMDKQLDEALGMSSENDEEEIEEKKVKTREERDIRDEIEEYYKEFSNKVEPINLDRLNEDELKEELDKVKGLVSKKNADSLVKYALFGLTGMIEYIGVAKFDVPLQGYQNNVMSSDSLDDIIKEIKIKYGFKKLDNILSVEFRLVFLLAFTGYTTIHANKNHEIFENIKNKETEKMENYKDL